MENQSSNPLLLTRLRVEDAINKITHQSPRLQHILRQRCRQGVKDRRRERFNAGRSGLEAGTSRMEEEEEEKGGNQPDVEMKQDEDYPEYDDYERMLQEEIRWIESLVYDRNKIICPICQTDLMIQTPDSIYCKDCGFWPTNCKNLITLGELMDNVINHHSINCTAIPAFTTAIENNSTVLYMMCYDCSYLSCVV